MMPDLTDDAIDPPKIEFPCLYPIKVIGESLAGFQDEVLATIERHTGKLDPNLVKAKPSRGGNYVSVNVTIAASGEEQLAALFEDLKKITAVRLVL